MATTLLLVNSCMVQALGGIFAVSPAARRIVRSLSMVPSNATCSFAFPDRVKEECGKDSVWYRGLGEVWPSLHVVKILRSISPSQLHISCSLRRSLLAPESVVGEAFGSPAIAANDLTTCAHHTVKG